MTSGGAQAGTTVGTPEGQTDTLKKLNLDTIPTMDNAQKFGLGNMRNAAIAKMRGDTQASVDMMNEFGGKEGYAKILRDATIGKNVKYGSIGAATDEKGLKESYGLQKFQASMGLTNTSTVKDAIGEYAKKHGITENEAMAEWLRLGVSPNKAVLSTFGNAENYENFLRANQELSAGKIDALTGIASGMGMDLRDYSKNSATIDNLKKSGMIDAYMKGDVTDADLQAIGKTGLLSEAGRADAAQKLADMFGGNVRSYESQLGTWKGMNEYTKFNKLQEFADSKRINLKDLMAAQHSGVITLPQRGRLDGCEPSQRRHSL